jgi:hypothetical protein
LAVNAGAVAIPLAFVVAVAAATPLNVPLAPLAGAVNVTVAPLTGLPPASITVACSAVPNAVLTVALCGVPALAAILAATPALFARLKLAEVATPATLAVTV